MPRLSSLSLPSSSLTSSLSISGAGLSSLSSFSSLTANPASRYAASPARPVPLPVAPAPVQASSFNQPADDVDDNDHEPDQGYEEDISQGERANDDAGIDEYDADADASDSATSDHPDESQSPQPDNANADSSAVHSAQTPPASRRPAPTLNHLQAVDYGCRVFQYLSSIPLDLTRFPSRQHTAAVLSLQRAEVQARQSKLAAWAAAAVCFPQGSTISREVRLWVA